MPDRMKAILTKAVDMGCSDIHLTVGVPPMVRSDGQIQPLEEYSPLTGGDTRALCRTLLNDEQAEKLARNGEVDFSYSMPGAGRFRVNVFRQRGSISAAIRLIPTELPTIDRLGLPPVLKELALKQAGIILVTGPTGSGKSTTLAAIINHINNNRRGHILTLEDPIEYLHKHNKCIVNQREIGEDSRDFSSALRAALREDPDVLLVGEMRLPPLSPPKPGTWCFPPFIQPMPPKALTVSSTCFPLIRKTRLKCSWRGCFRALFRNSCCR